MTVREPEFSVQDRAWIMADHHDEHLPRGDHGLPMDVALDRANRGLFDVTVETDFAAKALSFEQRRRAKGNPDEDVSTLVWRVKKK